MKSGFSLIEVLAAAVLLALTSATVVLALRLGARAGDDQLAENTLVHAQHLVVDSQTEIVPTEDVGVPQLERMRWIAVDADGNGHAILRLLPPELITAP